MVEINSLPNYGIIKTISLVKLNIVITLVFISYKKELRKEHIGII